MSARGVPGLALKALYTIAELAKLACLTHQSMNRLLMANGVVFVRSGTRKYVSAAQLAVRLPALWASLTAVEAARRRAEASLSERAPPR